MADDDNMSFGKILAWVAGISWLGMYGARVINYLETKDYLEKSTSTVVDNNKYTSTQDLLEEPFNITPSVIEGRNKKNDSSLYRE